jgi:IclR family transcriptional regulator, KDG regulon repressor
MNDSYFLTIKNYLHYFTKNKIKVHNMELSDSAPKKIYRVQVLERALDILDAFSYQQRTLTLTDIVARVGLKKATAKRLLANLTDRGYLKFDVQTKQYELGLRLFELGSVVFTGFSIRKAAGPQMKWLMQETGLTILLGQCQEDRLVYVEKYDGPGYIQISSTVGQLRQLHFGMLGQILMAYMPMEKVEQILKQQPLQVYTPDSITDPDAFYLRLAKIRENGYLIERGEAHRGVTGIAAPIRNASREVVAALGAAMPFHDYVSPEQIDRILGLVRQAVERISSELGYLKI